MKKSSVGLVGLAVMGANLARNIASRGFDISVYNRSPEKTKEFIDSHGNAHLFPFYDIRSFVESLESPRNIIVFVQAGKPVDMVIDELLPHLSADDCIIDCGNSHYRDTIRRGGYCAEKGIRFMGCGVSGGEEGALLGPSIMPGGDRKDYDRMSAIFEAIAARDFDDRPCVTHVGPDGAGHFVKMVHNGIEYAVMQMMAEGYDSLRKLYRLSAPEIASVFEAFSHGKLDSYLFDIAVEVLKKEDEFENSEYLVDSILDVAGQKWTGKWTVIDALERWVALPSIAEAVFARNTSTAKPLRRILSNKFERLVPDSLPPIDEFILFLEDALYASMLSAYAQGYDLILSASRSENWNIDLAEVSRIWEGGCIIRSDILRFLNEAFSSAPEDVTHLFGISEAVDRLSDALPGWHRFAGIVSGESVAIPAISSALAYFESMTNRESGANFLQGLRDYFGAHTYQRTDQEGIFHTKWNG